jgi:peptidoglycan-associated lipoprotein
MRTCTLLTAAILTLASSLPAQVARSVMSGAETGPLEVALAYSSLRGNGSPAGCECFWLQGGKAEFNAKLPVLLPTGFTMVGELAGQTVNNINSAHQDISLVSYLFGVRYSYRTRSAMVLFGQALVGGVHGFNAIFPNPKGTMVSPDSLATAPGGGLDIGLSRHLALRPFQADYFFTHLPNAKNNRQNSPRLAAGIVFIFGSNQ